MPPSRHPVRPIKHPKREEDEHRAPKKTPQTGSNPSFHKLPIDSHPPHDAESCDKR